MLVLSRQGVAVFPAIVARTSVDKQWTVDSPLLSPNSSA